MVVVMVANAQANEWERGFDMGATLSKGNSDSVMVTLGYSAEKSDDQTELTFDLEYAYGEENSSETMDEFLSDGSWSHLIDEVLYAGMRYDFRKDSLADIDYRMAMSGLVGMYFLKDDTVTLSAEAGFGYTWEKTDGDSDDFVNVYFGEKYEYNFDEKTKFYQDFRLSAPLNQLDDYSIVAEAGVETSLTKTLSLKVYVQDKYENDPAAGVKKNDFKLVTGVSYRF